MTRASLREYARGPALTLLGAIDNATSEVVALHFRPTEDLHGYATLLHQVFTTYGVPVALHGDRSNILARTDQRWSCRKSWQGSNPHAPGAGAHEPGCRLSLRPLAPSQRPRRAADPRGPASRTSWRLPFSRQAPRFANLAQPGDDISRCSTHDILIDR